MEWWLINQRDKASPNSAGKSTKTKLNFRSLFRTCLPPLEALFVNAATAPAGVVVGEAPALESGISIVTVTMSSSPPPGVVVGADDGVAEALAFEDGCRYLASE